MIFFDFLIMPPLAQGYSVDVVLKPKCANIHRSKISRTVQKQMPTVSSLSMHSRCCEKTRQSWARFGDFLQIYRWRHTNRYGWRTRTDEMHFLLREEVEVCVWCQRHEQRWDAFPVERGGGGVCLVSETWTEMRCICWDWEIGSGGVCLVSKITGPGAL